MRGSPIKVALGIGGLAAIGAIAGAAGGVFQPSRGPQARAVTRYEVGTVKRGEAIEVTVSLHNIGTRPLEIRSIRNDCGCTTVSAGAPVVPPGEATDIVTSVATDRFEGAIEKTIDIYTNDHAADPMRVSIVGNVEPEFDVSPAVLDFGHVTPGQRIVQSIEVVIRDRALRGRSFRSVRSTAPDVSAVFEQDGARGDTAVITVRFQPQAERALIFGNIVVTTSSAFMPELRVPVRAYVGAAAADRDDEGYD
jgi:hypothetical protein